MAITRRQREVYDFLERFINEHGYSPSFEEIGEGLGLSSLATVHKHISNLESKGLLKRDYNRMLELGGNIYFTAKLGATDGHSFQHLAAVMTGSSQQDYAAMMLAGGRSVQGNRSKSGKDKTPRAKSRAKAKSPAKSKPTARRK